MMLRIDEVVGLAFESIDIIPGNRMYLILGYPVAI